MKTTTFCLVLWILGTGLSGWVESAGCHGTDTPGSPNDYPILDGQQSSRLVNSSSHGQRYVVTVPNGGGAAVSQFHLLHVYGTPYEMGYAQGELMREQAVRFITDVWEYLQVQAEGELTKLFPKWLADLVAEWGLDVALDLTWDLTAEYTGEWFYQEMHGLADATGLDYNTIVKIHMIAGLTQGKCSMFGAWGDAVAVPGSLLQLRALDWDMDGPFRDHSQVTVYHPANLGHPFISVGMTGFLGGLTGMSSTQLGISEIGVSYPDASFGSESRIGVPFVFLLRDILMFDATLQDSIRRLQSAARTCDLILGVGDGKTAEFRGFQYSSSVLNVMDDTDLMPDNATWHPRISNVVYWGMDWLCPAYDKIMSDQLKTYHGKLTAPLALAQVTPVERSGDSHIAYYDLTSMELYVSFPSPHGIGGPPNAYDRQFVRFNATALMQRSL